MKRPLVSILICTYNAECFIKETLLSVLSQSYQNIEVLILDNASSDKTVAAIAATYEVGKGPSVRLIQGKKNLGPYGGLNFLLDKAKGKYIAINDHDDIWYPEKLKKQIEFLEEHQEYIGCGTAIINWYEKYGKNIYRTQSEKSDIAWHSSLVFRNNHYKYDTSVKVGTDFYFIKNILCKNKKVIYNFQEPLVLRRIFKNSGNLSGKWMQGFSFKELIKLDLPFIDKLAILNRKIMPKEFVEWIIVKIWGDNIPKKYKSYATTYQIT